MTATRERETLRQRLARMAKGRRAVLTIDDRSVVSSGVSIFVADPVKIGADCIIGPCANIFDNPGHPTDPQARLGHEPMLAEEIRPVIIEDNCWISSHVRVLPGVRIGTASVIGTSSVVTHSIPSYSLAAGNPARVIRSLAPAELGDAARDGPEERRTA